MSQCLITTLKESVNDDALSKLDEVVFYCTGESNTYIDVQTPSAVSLTIIGDGYFTNAGGTANLGKTKSVTNGPVTKIYISKGTRKLKISNKSQLIRLTFGNGFVVDLSSLIGLYNVGIFGLENSINTGDISVFNYLPNAKKVGIYTSKSAAVTGDFASLSGHGFTGIMMYTPHLKGTTSDVVNCMASNATEIQIANTNITGDVSEFSSLSNLSTLNISGCSHITGNTNSLAGMNSLTTFNYANSGVTGNWPLV